MKTYAETPEGILMMADGLSPVQKFDGFAAQPSNAGLVAPPTGLVLTAGTAPVLGTTLTGVYSAYLRFLDVDGNPSNFSPISSNAAPSTGNVTAATNATPITITSATHGLSTGATVIVANSSGNTAANGEWVITVIDANSFRLDGSVGNGAYTGGGTWSSPNRTALTISGKANIRYSQVFLPTENNAVRRQILRNTTGEAATYYVDVDTTDITSTGYLSGKITAATNASPVVITSSSHGLLTGARVTIRGVRTNTAANSIWTITRVDANTFSLDGSTGNGAFGAIPITGCADAGDGKIRVTAAGHTLLNDDTITISGVVGTTEANGSWAIRWNTVNSFDLIGSTFANAYVSGGSITPFWENTFITRNTDAILLTQTAVPILDTAGAIFANQYGVPPNWKKVIVQHLNRMFFAVDAVYNKGSVKVTNGSSTVTGVGTVGLAQGGWTTALEGRFLYVNGASQAYEILTVDAGDGLIFLTEAYADDTNLFATYSIRPAPAERKTVYYSQSGLPAAVPATNAFTIPEDGDDLTGEMSKGSFLYLLEKRHIYRETFQTDPGTDGFVFLATVRGCINQRCWVIVEDVAYMLDEAGVHAFAGGGDTQPVSVQVQEIFRVSDSPYRINWQAGEDFHAVHFPQQETIRWFVCLAGSYAPKHALAYNYRAKRWWIEEWNRYMGASCVSVIYGQPAVLLGTDGGTVLAMWQGYLDGADAGAGTVRGSVTSAGFDSIADSLATFASSNLVGNPIVIVSGTGEGQARTIASVSGHTIKVTQPWAIMPAVGSIYQLGGIPWRFQSGWFKLVVDDTLTERRLAVSFQPQTVATTMTMRLYVDFSTTAMLWGATYTSAEGNGVATVKNGYDLLVDMTKARGFAQKRMPGQREFNIEGPRYITFDVSGVSNQAIEKIYQVTIDGATQ